MSYLIGILGAVQLAFGLFVVFAARTSFHEITAATCYGLGTLALGLAYLIRQAEKADERRNQAAADAKLKAYMGKG